LAGPVESVHESQPCKTGRKSPPTAGLFAPRDDPGPARGGCGGRILAGGGDRRSERDAATCRHLAARPPGRRRRLRWTARPGDDPPPDPRFTTSRDRPLPPLPTGTVGPERLGPPALRQGLPSRRVLRLG